MVRRSDKVIAIQLGGKMGKLDQVFELAKQMNTMNVEYSRLAWIQYTAGYDFGLEETNKKIMDFLQDKAHFEIIKNHMNLDLDEIDKRRMAIMFKTFETYHKSEEINELSLKMENKTTELSKVLNTFRFKLQGKEVTSVELTQILNSSEDRELRKEAYLAKNQINQPMIDAGFLELIDMRKELAQLNGFENYIEMRLDADDLKPEIFSTWKSELNALLPEMKAMREEYAMKYLDDSVIYPWDEAYVSSKIAPSLNKKVDMLTYYEKLNDIFSKFGFNLDEYNITYDVFSRKNKSEWGYNFPIETRKDSRILANVKDKFYEFGVLLHETGHGVHSFLNDPELVILNDGISGIITEGIANLFGSLILDETFFSQFFDTDLDQAKEEFKAIKKWRKLNALRTIGRIMFDQAFYINNNQSLEDVYDMYWQINKEYLGEEKGDYEPPWAFLIHHTTHPIYLHNYFMGDVTCEMLIDVFNAKYGTERITEKPAEFGEFLKTSVIKPSGLYPYNELFERISNKPFSLDFIK